MNSPVSAGYSGTPQLSKLGVAAGIALTVVRRPRGWEFEAPLPDGVTVVRAPAKADVVLAFATTQGALDDLASLAERIFPSGAIWVAWPRKAPGHVSEVTENLIRDRALALGLVDVKVAAIDTDWSGLKVVWRKELRVRST